MKKMFSVFFGRELAVFLFLTVWLDGVLLAMEAPVIRMNEEDVEMAIWVRLRGKILR